MKRSRSAAWAAVYSFILGVFVVCGSARVARAERTLVKDGDWAVFTDGRVGAFLNYVRGDGRPQNAFDPVTGNQLHDVKGGGLDGAAAREPKPGGVPGELTQGTIEDLRIRSGFVANTLGVGVRGPLGYSTVTTYIQIWALAETDGRTKNRPNIVDVRQAYGKLEGWWGSLLVGRARALFSRGATDINGMYAHRFGVGYVGNLDGNGPTAGHIGFGVLGSGFAPGVVYATPLLGGLQLTVGAYDPIQIAAGNWTRTKYVRPEAEMTFERPLGTLGKFVLFGNGAFQKLYHDGQPDSINETAAGVGYGGRLELGPARLGVAGHYGRGLGLTYALESSDANSDATNNIRKFDGYYVQGQLVLGVVDISAGWGISRVFQNPTDRLLDPTGMYPIHSIIDYQMGNSAGIVYHAKPWLHFDLDAFRAAFKWTLGERQVAYIASAGMTITW